MRTSQNPPAQDSGGRFRNGINIAYLLLSGYATCFSVFLHHCFGGEAFGFNALAAIGIMIAFMLGYPQSPGLGVFFCLWWGAIVLQRIGHFTRRLRGVVIHSRYDGTSWFEIIPFVGPNVARLLEVIACLSVGVQLIPHDFGLARFIGFGGFALLFKWMLDGHIDHLRIQRMHDASIDQRARVVRWRGGGH